MSDSQDLLSLIHEFPQAFTDPETATQKPGICLKEQLQAGTTLTAKTQQLLHLVTEFPQAFADPESIQPALAALDQSSDSDSTSALSNPESQQAPQPTPTPELRDIPVGYAYALRRRVSTLTWGQVDFHLTYEAEGLAEIWITVGKSGTEVQSLSEAIARLINLLLAKQIPLPDIVREIRGIQGGDSEGLGPHRILGLADLIGKVLQEAPERSIASSQIGLEQQEPQPLEREKLVPQATTDSTTLGSSTPEASTWIHFTSSFEQLMTSPVSASLCPECGAELSQTNGCKGGACIVCGYSSCS